MRKSPKAEKIIMEMETRRNRPLSSQEREDKTVRGYFCAVMVVLVLMMGAMPVMAAGDPLASINKLSDFIFAAIKAIGLILLGLLYAFPRTGSSIFPSYHASAVQHALCDSQST